MERNDYKILTAEKSNKLTDPIKILAFTIVADHLLYLYCNINIHAKYSDIFIS